MIGEPALALAVSAREWPDRLRDWLADHGGARVRLTALSPYDLAEEEHDVLFIDDISSFLTLGLVRREQAAGRMVVGVFDTSESAGEAYLASLGVDATIAEDESPESFVAIARRGRVAVDPIATTASVTSPAATVRSIVSVRGVSGGVGVTEIAFALADLLDGAVLVEMAALPCMAQRAALPLHPNLATAAELVDHSGRPASDALQRIVGSVDVLIGVADRLDVGRGPVRRVVESLAEGFDRTILDVGCAPDTVVPPDQEVVVSLATPVGIRRAIDVLRATEAAETHLVLNRAPRGAFERSEVMRVVLDEVRPRSLTIVPEDPAVTQAAWNGTRVGAGPFRKAATALADAVRFVA